MRYGAGAALHLTLFYQLPVNSVPELTVKTPMSKVSYFY